MSDYTYNDKAADPTSLLAEVQAGSFAADLDAVTTEEIAVGGNRDITISMNRALTGAEQTELDGIISSHTP